MPTAAEVQASVEQLVADGDKFNQIVHGDATTTVTTDNGPVGSVAKVIKDMRDGAYEEAVEAAELSIETARSDAVTSVNTAATNAGLDVLVENIGAVTAVSENISNIDTLVANLDAIQDTADVISPVPVFLTTPRAITIADNRKTMFLGFNGPGRHCIQSMVIPLDGSSPFPAGTRIDFVCTGTAAINFVRPNGDVIAGLSGSYLGNVGDQGSLVKTEVADEWVLFGSDLIERPADAFDMPKVWLDMSDASTMRQERTGASATTPVVLDGPVGSIRNKGTAGGWATITADNRRPLWKEDATGRRHLLTDGDATAANADFLVLDGIAIDMAKLNLYVGFKPAGYQFADGIISVAPFDASGDQRNDAFAISQISTVSPFVTDYAFNTGASGSRISAGVQGVNPELPHVFEWRKAGNSVPAVIVIDGKEITHQGATGIAALANTTALVSATVRLILGGNPGNAGQGGAIQHSNTGYYGVVMGDDVLTPGQRAAIRAGVEDKTYPASPVFPSVADMTALTALRTTLQTEVFGGALPTDVATKTTDSSVLSGITNLASVQKLTIPGESDVKVKPRLWTPNSARSDVVVFVWAGHAAGWNANGIQDQVIQPMLTAGVRVVSLVLPDGPNDYTSGDPGAHGTNKTPYAKWLRQFAVAVNTVLADTPGAKIIVTGISGGGWAAMMCGAIDPRVGSTVQFVGSMTEDRYVNRDFEQWLTETSLTGLELYLLGAAGTGRRHIQVLHEDDAAGFDRAAYESRAPYEEGLDALAAALGGGHFELQILPGSLHALFAADRAVLEAELP